MLTVRDLMTENPYFVRADDDLSRVYDLMTTGNFRHLPVVDEDMTVMGLVSQRDLLRGALGQAMELPLSVQRELLREAKVQDIMVTDPATVDPDLAAAEAGELMMSCKMSCLPVVEGSRLVGILTEADFVRHVVTA
ncbi:MAG: CBS domain-containing protein [Myxococcota bacterium]